MNNNEKALFAVIATSAFWLFVLHIAASGVSQNSYRMGYAEGKAGMPPRYDVSTHHAEQTRAP